MSEDSAIADRFDRSDTYYDRLHGDDGMFYGLPQLVDGLPGLTVSEVRLSIDKRTLHLGFDDDTNVWVFAAGDCCSSSWFEHIEGLDALLGHKVLKVVPRKMPEESQEIRPTEYDSGINEEVSIKYYGFTIETARGRCDFEVRNSSNGFYGAELNVSRKREYLKTKYAGDPVEFPDEAMKPLTEDF